MYSIKNLEAIANTYVNGETNTIAGMQKKLISWFCFVLNTTPKDPRLLEMTFEELLVFHLMHQINNNPNYTPESEQEDYEKWLREEMGDNYLSEEQMTEEQINLALKEQEEINKIKEELPEIITTDFDQFTEGE